MATLTIPQHDQRPFPRVALRDSEITAAAPLGYAVALDATDTAYWLMRPVTDLALVLRVEAIIVDYGVASSGPDDPGTPAVVEWQPDITGAPWGDGHHTGTNGIYDQEVEVQDVDGLPMTVPTLLPNTIIVRDDVDSEA